MGLGCSLQGDHEAVLLDDSEASIRQPIYQKLVLVLSDETGVGFKNDYVGLSKNLKFMADQIVLLTFNVAHQREPVETMISYKAAELNGWNCNGRFGAV